MSNHSKIKAILLDKDGVLVDFQKTYGMATRKIILELAEGDLNIFNRLARDVGIDPVDNYIHPQSPLVAGCGEDICGVWANVLGIANDRPFQIRMDLAYKQLTGTSVVLIDGVGEVLRDLKTDYLVGIATNDTEECARAQLGHKELVHFFDFLAGYDSGHGPKPGTGMAMAFFQSTSIKPENAVMVGDSVHDMDFARAAGMTAIGISTGPLPGEELAPHADYCIDSLAELRGLLLQL